MTRPASTDRTYLFHELGKISTPNPKPIILAQADQFHVRLYRRKAGETTKGTSTKK